MRQLFNVLIGSLIMSGYFLYESLLFGAMFWLAWNLSVVPYFGLAYLGYVQAVAVIFIVKIVRFDSGKFAAQPTQIVIPKETSQPKESKQS